MAKKSSTIPPDLEDLLKKVETAKTIDDLGGPTEARKARKQIKEIETRLERAERKTARLEPSELEETYEVLVRVNSGEVEKVKLIRKTKDEGVKWEIGS